jgi:16S rRNA (cytidine1402-2'-O)-methyltransferase
MTSAQAAPGRLVVCPTPIGNLGDVTLRVIDTLREADLVACEDTRHTRPLLERHAIATPLISFHEHNEVPRSEDLIARIAAGDLIALVSDAGTPLVSDPGFQLIRRCLDASLPVEVLPGPTAVITALVASGLPASSFSFAGFLPRSPRPCEALLAANEETLIAFESPRRLARTLALLAALDPDRPLAVCRELTKVHEEVRRGSARELAAHYRPAGGGESSLRGEVVLVIGPAPHRPADDGQALEALGELVAAGAKPRVAAGVVARLTGTRPNDLYRRLTGSPPAPAGRGDPG